MTENNKPEWFEMTETDEQVAVRKVSKSLPIAAFVAAALIIGVGAVVAQTQESVPAGAVESVSTPNEATVATVQDSTPASGSSSNESTAPQKANAGTTTITQTSIATPNTSGMKNPSIANLPTKTGDDDDDEGDDDEDEGDDD